MKGYQKMNIGFGIGILLLFLIGFVDPRQTPTEEENIIHANKRGFDYDQHLHQEHHHHHNHHHHKEHHHHYNRIDKFKNKKHNSPHHHRKNKKRGRALPSKGGTDERPHPLNEKADVAAPKNYSDAVFESSSRKRREKEHLAAKLNESDVTGPITSLSTTAAATDHTTESTAVSSTSTTAKPASRHIIPTATITEDSSIKVSCTTKTDCTNITNSVCSDNKLCECKDPLPVLISTIPECTRSVPLNSTCEYDEQCSKFEQFSTCDQIKKICNCVPGYEMKEYPDVGVNCVTKSGKSGSTGVDPAMIGVLAGLALMFVIICVVLRLFSKARFRENRSIFNTPNPRLMNASLFKDSKLLSPSRGERRGSRASTRGPPSRAPSITSVNKDGVGRSPNGSLSKGRRGSTLSTASATGSAAAATAAPPSSAKTPSPTCEKKQPTGETAVAIEAVD